MRSNAIFTAKSICLMFFFGVILLFSSSVYSQSQSPSVGSNSLGRYGTNRSCNSGYVLIGFEVKYGPTSVGKLRGLCRMVGSSGVWAGNTQYTGWSRTNSDGESTHTRSRTCSPNWIVSGFEARMSGSNVRALRFKCRKLAPGGLQRVGSQTGWVGANAGTRSDWKTCGFREPAANGFRVRSTTSMYYFRLACGDIPFQSDIMKKAFVRGGDIYTYARARGYIFNAQLLPGSARGGRCMMYKQGRSLFFEVLGFAGAYKCRFNFFVGRKKLKNGWKIMSADINDECPLRGNFNPDIVLSENPYFVYEIGHTMMPPPAAIITCVAELKSVTLWGPSEGNWKDAF